MYYKGTFLISECKPISNKTLTTVNQTNFYEKLINWNAIQNYDWIEFYRKNTLIDVLIVLIILLFYIIFNYYRQLTKIDESKETSIKSFQQNNDKLDGR